MNKELLAEIMKLQKENLWKAFNQADCSANYYDSIKEYNESGKRRLNEVLNGHTHLIENTLTEQDIIRANPHITTWIRATYPEYSFNFVELTAQRAGSNNKQSLSKFLSRQDLSDFQSHHADKVTYIIKNLKRPQAVHFISTHTDFLLGCSVTAYGNNVARSCHHPAGINDTDYSAGITSYAVDNCTICTGVFKPGYGLIGRQLFYLDLDNDGLITARMYGNMTETDSRLLRYKLYELLGTKPYKRTKNDSFMVNDSDFTGYLDSGEFTGYRLTKDINFSVEMSQPFCIQCGSWHSGSEFMCCRDNYTSRCYSCNERVHEDDLYHGADGYYHCENCFYENFDTCRRCGEVFYKEDVHIYDHETYCRSCLERKGVYQCDACSEYSDDLRGDLCPDCVPDIWEQCYHCGEWTEEPITDQSTNRNFCNHCADRQLIECAQCGDHFSDINSDTTDGSCICDSCAADFNTCSCGTIIITDGYGQGTCSPVCATENLFSGGY